MKKILAIAAALMAIMSCQEWDPVFTLEYDDVYPGKGETLTANTTIAQLKKLYAVNGNRPLKIEDDDMVISGKVVSNDESGNIYKELYIQDETGAISLKIGKSYMYGEYRPGQTLYVKCGGLTLGAYGGMPQLGVEDPSGDYETAYIQVQYMIDAHIIRGPQGTPVTPKEVTEDDIKKAISEKGFDGSLWGQLVTVKDLQYGAPTSYSTDKYKRIFVLFYIDQFKDKKASSNRMFCSSETYGVTSWAMSKNKFLAYLDGGHFDGCATADNKGMDEIFDEETGLTVRQTLRANAIPASISQYFHLPSGTSLQIRTSGYAKFADEEIDPSVIGDLDARDGALIDATGILTYYNGEAQLLLIDASCVSIQK